MPKLLMLQQMIPLQKLILLHQPVLPHIPSENGVDGADQDGVRREVFLAVKLVVKYEFPINIKAILAV